jgi:acylphosphatase
MSGQETDERVRAHVHVSGRVQGVFFRATTRERAHQYDVEGWVQNLADGRVEAVFEGTESAVESMIDFCHGGSEAARVEDVSVAYEEPTGQEGFRIER